MLGGLCTLVIVAAPLSAATIDVPADHATIQAAVNAASPGDTIVVAAGTYNEFVTITKSLTLLGEQAGVDARTGRPLASESIVDGSGLAGVIWVNGNGISVTIDGFTLQSDAAISVSNGGFGAAITTVQSANLTNLQILNNIVRDSSIGIAPQGDSALIQYNLIEDMTIPGPAAGSAIYTDFGLTNSTIDSNKVQNVPNSAININSSGSNNIVSNNELTSQIYLHAQSGSQVTGNRITNSVTGGVVLGGNQSGLIITNNEVNGVIAGFGALRIRNDAGGPNSNVTVTNNKFLGTNGYGVRPSAGSYTGTLTLTKNHITGTTAALQNDDVALAIDASANYWGTSNAATVAASITGAGAANVDFTPLINNDESLANQAVVGFQDDMSSLTVHTLGAQTGSTGRVQEGVDSIADGALTGGNRVLNVLAGVYAEQVTVNQAVSMRGAQFGVDARTRAVAPALESIIVPDDSDPDPFTLPYIVVVTIAASDVTIDGFIIDGDNPSLSSGLVYNGADIDAEDGIGAFDPFHNNIIVTNNIIKNFSWDGIDFYPDNGVGHAASTGNEIKQNRISNLGGNFGDVAILIYNDFYAEVEDNLITDVYVGIQTGNNYLAGGPASISNNEIVARSIGIFHNLHYANASDYTLANNDVSAMADFYDNGYWVGIILWSLNTGVSATLTDNIVDGSASDQLDLWGYDIWNLPTTATPSITGGSVSGVNLGMVVSNFSTYGDGGLPGTDVTISGVDISAVDVGIWVQDSASNTNGSTVHANITNDTNITTLGTGVLVDGAAASASVTNNDNSINGNLIGIDVDAGSATVSTNHIYDNGTGVRFTNGGSGSVSGNDFDDDPSTDGDNGTDLRIDATAGSVTIGAGNSFAGDTYFIDNQSSQAFDLTANSTTYDEANSFRIEDKMFHALDAAASGRIEVIAGQWYVTTPGTGASDETIQRGVNTADSGDTVNVEPGTFSEFVTITKSLTLLGEQAGVDARTGRIAAPESIIDGSGLLGIVWINGNGITVKIDGFTMQSDNAISVFNNGFGAAITTVQSANLTGLEIVNNIIQDASIGIAPQGDLALIQYNLIKDMTIPGPAAGSGIYTDFGLTNSTIDSNKLENIPNTAVNINTSGSSNIVSNNEMDGQIYLHAQSGSQVTGNKITNSSGGGVVLGGNQSGISIMNNEVNGVIAGFGALRIRNDAGGPNSLVTVMNNKFIGTGGFGVRPSAGSYTGTLTLEKNQISGTTAAIQNDDAALNIDASSNYWGTSVPGSISILGAGAANVDFTSLIDQDESLANQAVVGFQADMSSLTAHSLGTQTGLVGRIQEGMNLLADGALTGGAKKLNVLAGAYTGGADASAQSLTLAPGASPAQVTVTGDYVLSSDDTLNIELEGVMASTQYDNFIVNGTVTLGNAVLNATRTFSRASNTQFIIISNDGNDPVNGTFFNMPEGTVINVSGADFTISYVGGDGNDVVLYAESATLYLTYNQSCFRPVGSAFPTQLVATLSMKDLTEPAAGFQAFLQYDTSRLAFVSYQYTCSPFGSWVLDNLALVHPAAGLLDLAAGIRQFPAGGPPCAPDGAQSPSMVDADLVILTFDVIGADTCPPGGGTIDNLLTFRTHNPPTRLTDIVGNAFSGLTTQDSNPVTIDGVAPTITCPADIVMVPLQCATDVPAAATNLADFITAGGSASDTCSAVTLTHQGDTTTPQGCDNRFTVARTYRTTDVCGNFTECTQTIVVFDNTPPIITDCADDVVVNPAAGDCSDVVLNASNFVTTASDNCTPAVPAASIVGVRQDPPFYDTNNPLFFSTPWPNGATQVIWTATDVCGNVSLTCTQTITVNRATFEVAVELSPNIDDNDFDANPLQGTLTRCITFEVWTCSPNTTQTTSEVLNFTYEMANSRVIAVNQTICVPATVPFNISCVTARDPLHTLRSRVTTAGGDGLTGGGGYYFADFTGRTPEEAARPFPPPNTPGPGHRLVGGNLNDDIYIDILDYGTWAGQFGLNYGTGNTACLTVGPHSDISGNGIVGSLDDFTFISGNFLMVAQNNCCSMLPFTAPGDDDMPVPHEGPQPVTSISVRQLHQMGLGHMAVGDVNHDGMLNQADMMAVFGGQLPTPPANVPVPGTPPITPTAPQGVQDRRLP